MKTGMLKLDKEMWRSHHTSVHLQCGSCLSRRATYQHNTPTQPPNQSPRYGIGMHKDAVAHWKNTERVQRTQCVIVIVRMLANRHVTAAKFGRDLCPMSR